MGSAREIDTGMEGFRFWPGALSASEQAALLDEVLAASNAAPFYRPVTPGGRPFSVEMTGLGPLFKVMADELEVVACEDGVRRYDVPGAPYADGTAPAPVR